VRQPDHATIGMQCVRWVTISQRRRVQIVSIQCFQRVPIVYKYLKDRRSLMFLDQKLTSGLGKATPVSHQRCIDINIILSCIHSISHDRDFYHVLYHSVHRSHRHLCYNHCHSVTIALPITLDCKLQDV